MGRILKASIIVLVIVLTSCAHVPPNDPSKSYLKDLTIEYNDREYQGFLIVPEKSYYHFEFEARKSPEKVIFTSCHIDIRKYEQKKEFEFDYRPDEKLETGACMLQIAAFDEKGRHQFGLIDFKRDDENLRSLVRCNGNVIRYSGASFCQARIGTIQGIEFERPVKSYNLSDCDNLMTDDDTFYTFMPRDGYCMYSFEDENGDIHRLTVFGYDGIMNR